MIQVQEVISSTDFVDVFVLIDDAHSLWSVHVCLQMGNINSRDIL